MRRNERKERQDSNRKDVLEAQLLAAVDRVGRSGGRYWRRASTRALGLIFNGFERLVEIVPG
jgi:hypothetical protein